MQFHMDIHDREGLIVSFYFSYSCFTDVNNFQSIRPKHIILSRMEEIISCHCFSYFQWTVRFYSTLSLQLVNQTKITYISMVIINLVDLKDVELLDQNTPYQTALENLHLDSLF